MYLVPLRYTYKSQLSPAIGGALGRYVQTKLGEQDLWKGPWGKTKEALRGGQSICERWVQACETLTSQYWKSYGPHPWKDDQFFPVNLAKLGTRLEEVHSHYFVTFYVDCIKLILSQNHKV